MTYNVFGGTLSLAQSIILTVRTLNVCQHHCHVVCVQRYVDGALTDNIPVLDSATITVSPFAGESDICPNDFSSSLHHISLAGNYQLFTFCHLKVKVKVNVDLYSALS